MRSIASSLCSRLEGPIEAGDLATIEQRVADTWEAIPDIRYIIVQDHEGKLLAHYFGFSKELPPEEPSLNGELCTLCHSLPAAEEILSDPLKGLALTEVSAGGATLYFRNTGSVIEAAVPISDGHSGLVRVGFADHGLALEAQSVTHALMRSLAFCVVIGSVLALGLAYLLVHPIHNLVRATNRIRGGDFEAKAKVYSADEVGELARAFNQMAEALRRYRREVRKKEAARVALIERVVHAQEEERKSVARELHDQLGQSLSRTLLSFQGVLKACGRRDPLCSQIESEMHGIIDDTRRLAWDIRPPILDDFGLDSALKRYVEDISKRAGIPFDYQCVWPDHAGRLPNRIEVTLYRIAQEAVTNVIRHAEARQTSVLLIRYDGVVSLLVEDDGGGFELSSVGEGEASSLGLMGMKERAGLIGGDFTIESQPGKGTVVRINIPLSGAHDADSYPDHG